MASLQNTKRRIKSVESTKKITKAMELVSSAKLKKAKDLFEGGNEVRRFIGHDLTHAIYEIAVESELPEYIEQPKGGKTLYIVVASDMGLCGGYNINAAKKAVFDSKEGDLFILVGKKTAPFIQAHNREVLNVYMNMSKLPKFYGTYYITKEAVDLFNSDEITSIKLVYTEFINSVSFEPVIHSLIPIEDNPYTDMVLPFNNKLSAEFLMKHLLRDYINSYIYQAIIESRVCEYASSRMAMENATDNANEIQEKLMLEYNRVRQANITQEISEIVGGADAL